MFFKSFTRTAFQGMGVFRSTQGHQISNLNKTSVAYLCTKVSEYEHLNVDVKGEKSTIGFIQLNRPKSLNALCDGLMKELNSVLDKFEADKTIRCVVLTGSEKAFAAGADIKEMKEMEFANVYKGNFLSHWGRVSHFRKPIIAAVNGFALGGGCELAMMCDIIYAGSNAQFGQPEILLGTIPGAGGTQRLTKSMGKYKTMELVLSGDKISAVDAERAGLVAKVFPKESLVDETMKLAERISNNSLLTLEIAKEAVNASLNLSLNEGLHFEKRLFHQTFATRDQKEGMKAFVEKRGTNFTDE